MKANLFSCLKKNPAPLAWLALHAAVFLALAICFVADGQRAGAKERPAVFCFGALQVF